MSTPLEWDDLRNRLEKRIVEVAEEIRAYPPPVTGCDAQFNHLLVLRDRLPQELARLDNAIRDHSLTVDEFIDSSPVQECLLDAGS